MQSLYNPDIYPDQIRETILQSGQLGIEIANRWMMGWAKESRETSSSGYVRGRVSVQLLQEQDVIARASNLSHLAPMEIVVMSGLSLEPPEM